MAQKALAITTDVTPRYCHADPFEGGKQAVAEAWRNLTAVGAMPLAVTDNLNFGNPGKARDHGPDRGRHRRHRRGLPRAGLPGRIGGNFSLYNETNGEGILPTPTIGGVGLIDDFTEAATLASRPKARRSC